MAAATESRSSTGSTDHAVVYDLYRGRHRQGRVTVTERSLQNGDSILFVRLEGAAKEGAAANLMLELDGNRFTLTDFDRRFKEHLHDKTTGIDPTTYPIGLLETWNFDRLRWSLMVGRAYVSRELVQSYDNGQASRLRELIREDKQAEVAVTGSRVVLRLPLAAGAGTMAERWLVAARFPLFRDPAVLDAWIDTSIEDYTSTNKWYTPEGAYTKLPWSVEPFTRLGYGRNLVNIQEKRALEQYQKTGERYFYDLVLNAIASLERMRDDRLGLWTTEYTSTWLKKQYGIIAPYVDTRHNENVGNFLSRAGRVLGFTTLARANIRYADFLVAQVKDGHVIETAPNGYLICDYFVPGSAIKTHASLNHSLGEMNYLLEAYHFTGNREYLEVARSIRRGIEALGDRWIRPNGDLWYQVNPDLTFSGTDYPLVTLVDLLVAQQRWALVGGERSRIFDRLIRSKATYLVREDKAITPEVRMLLEEQGFRDVVRQVR